MFDVLVYVYENYWRPDACPEPRQLSRKLSAVGFETEEIDEALAWLDGLQGTGDAPLEARPDSQRVWTPLEKERLGDESIGFLTFLESARVLSPLVREQVVDRAMAAGQGTMELVDLKIVVLMVFWSLGLEPDALVLDELFVAPDERLIH
jgi:Smg protein